MLRAYFSHLGGSRSHLLRFSCCLCLGHFCTSRNLCDICNVHAKPDSCQAKPLSCSTLHKSLHLVHVERLVDFFPSWPTLSPPLILQYPFGQSSTRTWTNFSPCPMLSSYDGPPKLPPQCHDLAPLCRIQLVDLALWHGQQLPDQVLLARR